MTESNFRNRQNHAWFRSLLQLRFNTAAFAFKRLCLKRKIVSNTKGSSSGLTSSSVDTVALFRLLLVYMDVRLSKRNHFCIKGRKWVSEIFVSYVFLHRFCFGFDPRSWQNETSFSIVSLLRKWCTLAVRKLPALFLKWQRKKSQAAYRDNHKRYVRGFVAITKLENRPKRIFMKTATPPRKRWFIRGEWRYSTGKNHFYT